jgi:hypothetical protein
MPLWCPFPCGFSQESASRSVIVIAFLIAIASTVSLDAQTPPPVNGQPHDISEVDPAPIGGAIAVPLQPAQQRRMKRYELPELVGSRQAIGSQLIDGRLPRPLVDYLVHNANVDQRLSLFEGGLVVINMTGAGGTIRKKVLIPDDALQAYLKPLHQTALLSLRLKKPAETRRATLRIYDGSGSAQVLAYDPISTTPKTLNDGVAPIEDLLRAISEDRMVTSTVAGYEPKVGDQLVGDDRKTYRVERVLDSGNIVELHCTSQPTILYVAKKDLYNYFIGAKGGQQ